MAAFAAKQHGGKTHVAAQKRPAAQTGKPPSDASTALTPMKRPAAHRDTATGTKKAKPAPEHSGDATKKTRCPSERVLRGEESAPPTQYNGGTIYVAPKKGCFRVMRTAGITTRRERLRIAWVHKLHSHKRCASTMRGAPSNGSAEPQSG